TSDRPYHKPMSNEAATALLRQEAGKALDPNAVEVFIRIEPAVRAEAKRAIAEPPRITMPPRGTDDAPMMGTPRQTAATSSVFDDIALAHREIYALYQIAQTMGTSLGVADTMALVSSKLTNLVPFNACALFLYSEQDDALHCRFATGTDSELISQLSLKSGQGLTGWV